ncbi:beta-lactamase/transpeptidase-like protein [Xylariaceae sp. FL0255]|nr:beta-lactamase/transpeptidase-like protein [Xylariaceae sp. FL0255]
MAEAAPLSVRLRQLEPRLRRVLELTGTPGCSIGVRHRGEEVCKINIGLRDVEKRLPVRSNTVFLLHSLTKAITAAAFAYLVDKDKVKWTTPVKSVIPELKDELLTPLDLLSMRSGYWPQNALSWQGNNIVLLKKEDTVKNWNGLQQLGGFRSSFKYNNWGVALVGILIERLTGQELGQVFKERFFEPLNLKNTKMYDSVRSDNWASSYGVLSDRSNVRIPEGSIGVGVFTEGGSGICSTIDDMLPLYAAYLAALKHQFAPGSQSTKDNPFVQCKTIFKGHTFLYPDANELLLEQTYACGWVRCQLPGPLGGIGLNSSQTTMPVVLEGGESHLCIYHQGMMSGSVSNISLIPDTETIVAVMANSSHLGDAADWISQMIIEEIFEPPIRNDYERIASEVSHKVLNHLPSVGRELEENRRQGSSPLYSLDAYVGTFWNHTFNFKIDVRVKNDHLSFTFNGTELETYDLKHYEDNTWVWWMPYDECCRRGRFVFLGDANYYLMRFDGVDRLLWQDGEYGTQESIFIRA